MSSYLQLTSYYVENRGGQVVVYDPAITVNFSDGAAVRVPLPFMPIGNGLALIPRVTAPDRCFGVQIDFSRWTPAHIANGKTRVLPIELPNQGRAVRLCREFHAAADTTWDDPRDEMTAWLQANDTNA